MGILSNSSITLSRADGAINGKSAYNGGLVGLANTGSSITNSLATAVVVGFQETGGLVGELNAASVSNSAAINSVTGIDYTGGLVGFARSLSSISTSFFVGSVSANSAQYIGGLVGYLSTDNSIDAPYSVVELAGTGSAFGLSMGANDDNSGDYNYTAAINPGFGVGTIGSLMSSGGDAPEITTYTL